MSEPIVGPVKSSGDRHFGASDLLWGSIYFSFSLSFCKMGIAEWILEDCETGNDKGRAQLRSLVKSGLKERVWMWVQCQTALGPFPGADTAL